MKIEKKKDLMSYHYKKICIYLQQKFVGNKKLPTDY